MLVKFLNSGDKVSTAIAGSYFKGDGWTGAYYDSAEGRLVFESEDGLADTPYLVPFNEPTPILPEVQFPRSLRSKESPPS